MDKIDFSNLPSTSTAVSAENLNAMQTNVEKVGNYIGSTQPSTGEKVWIKKGNNLYDETRMIEILGGYRSYSDGQIILNNLYNGLKIPVEPNSTYRISYQNGQDYKEICFLDLNSNFLNGIQESGEIFNTPANCYFATIVVKTEATNIMISEGSTARPYEPYVKKEILVKNDNGVFEKFIQENEEIDTGWVDITLQNGVTARDSTMPFKPQIRRIGNIVYLKGQINIPANITVLATIPERFRPSYEAKFPSVTPNCWLGQAGEIRMPQSSSTYSWQAINTSWVLN